MPRVLDAGVLGLELVLADRHTGVEALTEQGWQEVARGTTIGHKKLDRLPPTQAARVRLTLDRSRGVPLLRTLGLYQCS